MRIIAGTFRGRPLAVPRGLTTRPITDRAKETLFNILGHRFVGPGRLPAFDVLDVFAGTGGLGLEALSRGARSCVFVERDRRALPCLRENIRTLRLEAACTVLTENAWTLRPPQTPAGFGLIFVDPPYRDSEDALRVADLLERLAEVLAPEGLLVFRQEAGAALAVEQIRTLRCVLERTLGSMRLLLLGIPPA